MRLDNTPGNLSRFVDAQAECYAAALEEIRRGKKETHWMWFVFPQLRCLGHSQKSRYYGIADMEEARDYLLHPLLGFRLHEISAATLVHGGKKITDILGTPDDRKLQSSMTLFACFGPDEKNIFDEVLKTFFGGVKDVNTLHVLGMQ